MRKVIKLAITFLIFVLIAVVNAANSAQEQSNNTGSRTQEKNDDANILDNEIKQLHKRVGSALKSYYNGKNVEKGNFTLDRGMTNRMGVRDKNVFEESITLQINGGEVSRIELFYTQTNVGSLITETRKIINSDVQGNNLGEIQLVYEAGPKSKSYKIKTLLKAEKRNKVKIMYRNYLTRLLKNIEYQLQQRKASEAYEIDKILDLGTQKN